jgi:hypothetical protein
MASTKKATRKILVKELNDVLTCTLCSGYLIDATTLTDCHHVFCRGCILRYFENCKAACPSCNTVYKKKNQVIFRADPQIQSIVYKMVPGLYSREMQRREDFYRSTGVRASSSCSDDSVLERERDMINDQTLLVKILPFFLAKLDQKKWDQEGVPQGATRGPLLFQSCHILPLLYFMIDTKWLLSRQIKWICKNRLWVIVTDFNENNNSSDNTRIWIYLRQILVSFVC